MWYSRIGPFASFFLFPGHDGRRKKAHPRADSAASKEAKGQMAYQLGTLCPATPGTHMGLAAHCGLAFKRTVI